MIFKTMILDKIPEEEQIEKKTEALLKGTPALRSENKKSAKKSWNEVEEKGGKQNSVLDSI